MGAQRFKVVENNPNSGGGCLCSETTNPDCKGPFAIFEATEMDSIVSPFPVLCLSCAESVVESAQREVLAGGEPAIELGDADVIEVTEVAPIEDDGVPRV